MTDRHAQTTPIRAETATVYRGGRQRWLTLEAACRAEAKAKIKKRYPPETDHRGDLEGLPVERWARMVRSLSYIYRQAYRRSAGVHAS